MSNVRAFPSRDRSAEGEAYARGVKAGVALLAEWKSRGESEMTAAELTAEWLDAIAKRNGAARQGLSDTIAAFVIMCLDGCVPDPRQWNAQRDLELWGTDHE